jgi:AbrB family looped-hinge helix DNA binding protein
MTVTIDTFGRILIPKKVRKLLRLSPGTCLTLEVRNNNTALHAKVPERPSPELVIDEFGIPTYVFDTDETMDHDFVTALRKDRQERGLDTPSR